MRVISASAALLGERAPADSITLAARAGYDWVGVRFDERSPSPREMRAARNRMDDAGVRVLDIEVVRIGHEPDDSERLIEWGSELGARFLLCVGEGPDLSAIVDRFAAVCEGASAAGMRAALEWMSFRTVASLADALDVLSGANHRAGALVVDALHLARSGGTPEDVREVAPTSLGYMQICDAPMHAPPGGTAALAREARQARLVPGDGGLPLNDLLAAVPPELPISIEVPNAASRAEPEGAARAARRAVEALLAPPLQRTDD